MGHQDRDLVWMDDNDSEQRSDQGARRLCIVSRNRLLCSPFMAALRSTLTPHDKLEIVVDRRREHVPTETRHDAVEQQFFPDRRRHPQVDRRLKVDGFAIVPTPATGSRARRTPTSLLPPEAPVEEIWLEDPIDEERLKSVRNFKRARTGRVAKWLVLVLPGLMSAVLIVFAPSSSVKTLVSWLRLGASSSERVSAPLPRDKEIAPVVHAASVIANPAEVQRPGLPKVASSVRTEHFPSDVPREFPATGGASETSVATRVLPNPRATAPPGPSVNLAISPIASNAAPSAVATRIPSPRFPGLPAVEVLETAAASAWAQGERYAVRISDAAGRPLDGADVLLLARMADGTVQSILLQSGSEPGIYQATVPGGPAPVDLRVGITTSDKRVEIPLSR